jgi:hypothetical protein
MVKTITKEQLKEIEEAYAFSKEDGFELLEECTGIVARPYTAYLFYDEADNCVGDSDNYDIRDLLENAYIKVVE